MKTSPSAASIHRSFDEKGFGLAGELEVAVAAAGAAGEILRNNYGREQEIRYKGEVDLVTEVDEQAERKIGGMLREAFPDYGMLAEEGGALTGGGEHR